MNAERVLYEVSGDTALLFNDRRGRRFSIQEVGIGHPWHTITTGQDGVPRGRVSTDAEVALAKVLIGGRHVR